ncbi:MAG: M48 family metallopeptidase, partial [Spirulinaceae cyanobacterium]
MASDSLGKVDENRAMNFFEQQDRAHQNTLYLLGLFVLALLGMVLAIYLVVVLAIFNTIVLQPGILAVILASVIGLVGAGSLYKFLALRAGGQVVARDLGGRLVQQETQNPKEAQLLNVVEEMAIASGVAVPMVYLLDREPGINAFAAGFTPHDAVIGITQGCLEQLDRDELQGVIAHEFSHILNGDMRLNLRLIAVLQGILIVHIVGRVICRGSYYAGGGRSSRSDREGGIAATFMVVGFALLVIGFIGLVCGRLIKSAISRQREFLADASAVQFTRNPAGLSGALRRIGGFQTGSAIAAPAAEEASHLFFGEAITGDVAFLSNFNWFGTHPPLKERIQRLENGVGTGIPLAAAGREQPRGATTPAGAMGLAGSHSSETASAKTQAKANQFVTTIGTVNAQNLQAVQQFLGRLPEPLRSATREAQGAIALIFTLLLDEATDVCNRQLTLLGQTCAPAVIQRVQQFQPLLQNLPA